MLNKEYKNIEEVIFIITARSGSKRLPNKNMKHLNGKPLIYWTINSVKKAFKKARVFISTDSKKIANFSKTMGIEVPFIRPKSISKDNSTSIEVVNHFLEWVKQKNKLLPKYIVLLQPTSPFRSSKTIKKCTTELIKNNNCNAIVAMKYQKNNINALKYLDKKMYLRDIKFKKDIQQIMEPTGSYYGINTLTFLKQQTFVPNKTIPYLINELEAIDIDNSFDWQIASYFANKLIT